MRVATSYNTVYTLRLRLALRDIAPFGRNVVYAGTIRQHCPTPDRRMTFYNLDKLIKL